MLVFAQIRMARAALGWNISDLASKASVSVSTIKRVETPEGFAKVTAANLKLIKQTLEQAGVEFIGTAEEGPGVRLWKQP
jgi:transcriptional regulator with XRE-family HTH domain